MPDIPFAGPSRLLIKHMQYERIAHIPKRSDGDTLLAHGALELIFAREHAKFKNPSAERQASLCVYKQSRQSPAVAFRF